MNINLQSIMNQPSQPTKTLVLAATSYRMCANNIDDAYELYLDCCDFDDISPMSLSEFSDFVTNNQ